MISPGVACGLHREALVDFVDRRAVSPDLDAALAHLEICDACMWELEATAMAIAALRRLHAEIQPLEPAPDAWGRLRMRVDRPREAVWRWRASLGALVVGAGLVATIIAPTSLWSPREALLQEEGLAPSVFAAQRLREDLAELKVLDQQRAARSVPLPQAKDQAVSVAPSGAWPGPDGLGAIGRSKTTQPRPIVRSS